MGELRGQSANRRLIVNPVSGGTDHVDTVHRLAALHQFPVVETKREGHSVDLAKAAPRDGVDLLVAEPIRFSLDGEMRAFEMVQFGVRPQALRVRVGSTYTPTP